ncbi:hypothetical protein Tco_1076574 [Tanacetum coccineum]
MSRLIEQEKIVAHTSRYDMRFSVLERDDSCRVFYLASSLKINIKKSNVYGIGVSDVDVSSMASFSRSHTLIKAVLGSLRIYYFSIFKVPESVLKLFGKILPNVFLERLYRLEREKSCLIIECIDHGRWRWNWSRPNLSARNSANLLDMLFEISSTELNEAHGSAHGLAPINDDEEDSSPIEEVSPVKPKKPSRRAARARKDDLKDPPKDWTMVEEIALCQA